MARILFDEDADLSTLEGQTIAVIGYGNQGRAQAQNIRDSGLTVIIGNEEDAYARTAREDGFPVVRIAEAGERGDLLLLLIPDEIMPGLFDNEIRPHLHSGACLCFASGYNLYYGLMSLPSDADVVMVAPRMVGTGVRAGYLNETGFPSLIAVHQDATGTAMARTLALAKAIGSTRMGVVLSSAEEETVCDLLNEHFGYVYAIRRAYEILHEAGYSPEAILLEFYMSGEEEELARLHREVGLFHQLAHHSRTSQYGQEVTARLSREDEERERARLRAVLENIRTGQFAKDWAVEQQVGFPVWRRINRENLSHPMVIEEQKLIKRLKHKGEPEGVA